MRLIGVVGSGSTTVYAPLLVYENHESLAKEEQLVIINDKKRFIKYLGVLRRVHRYEPFLDPRKRTSYVDNPTLVDHGVMPHTSAWITLIGSIQNKMLSDVQLPPNPGSYVYVIESPEDLDLRISVKESIVVGKHKYSGIEIPLDVSAIPLHTVVVGATGTGKSRLVKALVDEIINKTNYSVIIFDHTGMDYVPYYEGHTVQASKIVLDPLLITDLILERTDLERRTYEPYVLTATLAYMIQTCKYPESSTELQQSSLSSFMKNTQDRYVSQQRDLFEQLGEVDTEKLMQKAAAMGMRWDKDEFKDLISKTVSYMRGKESARLRLSIAFDIRLGNSFFDMLSERTTLPRAVVSKVLKEKLVVVDLSSEDILVRKYIVSAIISELWKIIESKREVINVVAVVDEAHNYACRFCGEPHKAISRVAREGRKWGFGLVLATQRMIDIDPEIRGNINTVFFSKLQTPSDFNEISAYMDLGGLTEASLAVLSKREFFVAGLMNTLRVPILLKVREVPSPGTTT
ncbi:MAG: hypothetical protein DRO15_04510 [Thermoprotei archaeon]|nr:MAG: hypothetical protein DRO15_04510 [Thermoprotei archaeon]